MLANASLSIPLPNKGAFIEIGEHLLIPGSWVGLDLLTSAISSSFIVVKVLSISQGLVTYTGV